MSDIGDDGLPISEVGEWALEKHKRLRSYVDICKSTRRKYVDPTKSKSRGSSMPRTAGASYIDLFCGPGRSRIRETHQIIDGSPLVAYRASLDRGVPFSEIHVADVDESYCNAAQARVRAMGGNAFGYSGPAEETARQIVTQLHPEGLHFAFLDPFNLGGLSFGIIETLSSLERIDILVHLSLQDLQRNSESYVATENSPLDRFAPGWRAEVDSKQALHSFRANLLIYWQGLVRRLGFEHQRPELVTARGGQRLYWLIFLSRHPIAGKFWREIRNTSGQGELGF
jgi:three-Cys-motif partner protein